MDSGVVANEWHSWFQEQHLELGRCPVCETLILVRIGVVFVVKHCSVIILLASCARTVQHPDAYVCLC